MRRGCRHHLDPNSCRSLTAASRTSTLLVAIQSGAALLRFQKTAVRSLFAAADSQLSAVQWRQAALICIMTPPRRCHSYRRLALSTGSASSGCASK